MKIIEYVRKYAAGKGITPEFKPIVRGFSNCGEFATIRAGREVGRTLVLIPSNSMG